MGGSLTRRGFLIRSGILGAAVALGRLHWPSPASAQSVDDVAALLRDLARDTFDGFVSMVIPGPDPYSVAQGVTSPRPGAIAAGASELVMTSFDGFFALPDRAAANIAVALASGLGAPPLALPSELAGAPRQLTDQLDEAVLAYTANDETVPVSLLLALALNQAAVQVNPAALSGQFISPFARLSYAEKLAALESLETATADVVATIDANLPEAETGSASGLIRFTANAVFALAAFAPYTEYGNLDAARRLTGRPLGWALTGYQPDGPVLGWAELRGYFRGHTKAAP